MLPYPQYRESILNTLWESLAQRTLHRGYTRGEFGYYYNTRLPRQFEQLLADNLEIVADYWRVQGTANVEVWDHIKHTIVKILCAASRVSALQWTYSTLTKVRKEAQPFLDRLKCRAGAQPRRKSQTVHNKPQKTPPSSHQYSPHITRNDEGTWISGRSGQNSECVWDAFACILYQSGLVDQKPTVSELKGHVNTNINTYVDKYYPEGLRFAKKTELQIQAAPQVVTVDGLAGLDVLAILADHYGVSFGVVDAHDGLITEKRPWDHYIMGNWSEQYNPLPGLAIMFRSEHAWWTDSWTAPLEFKRGPKQVYPDCLLDLFTPAKAPTTPTTDIPTSDATQQTNGDQQPPDTIASEDKAQLDDSSLPSESQSSSSATPELNVSAPPFVPAAAKCESGVNAPKWTFPPPVDENGKPTEPPIPNTSFPNRNPADEKKDVFTASATQTENDGSKVVELILNMLRERAESLGTVTKEMAKRIVPVAVMILSQIYNITKMSIAGLMDATTIVINVASFVAAATSLYFAITDALAPKHIISAIGDAVRELCSKPTFCSDSYKLPSGYGTALKGVTLLGVIIAMATGFGGSVTALSKAVQATNIVGNFSTDVTSSIGAALGFSHDKDIVINDQIRAQSVIIDRILCTQNATWVGERFEEVRLACIQAREVLAASKVSGCLILKNQLMRNVAEVESRLHALEQDRSARGQKVVPVGLYLWSRIGGLGKTELAIYLPKLMAHKIKGFNSHTYHHKCESNHWNQYLGEHTVHFDEVGALKNSTEKSPFFYLNELVSSHCGVFPGAALEAKSQTLKPLLVICTTNFPLDEQNTGLKTDAYNALKSRFIQVEVVDRQFKLTAKADRCTQAHRQADFSHLEFRLTGGQEVNVDQLATLCCQQLQRNIQNYETLVNCKVDHYPIFMGPDGQMELPEWCSGSDLKKYVHWVAGKPGTMKTTEVIPLFMKAAELMHMESMVFNDMLTAETAIPRMPEDLLIVLDDAVRIDSDGQSRLLVFLNKLPIGAKVLIISNHGPEAGWTDISRLFPGHRPKDYYDPFKLVAPGLARRCGFDRTTQEGTLLIKKLAGLVRERDNKTFSVPDILHDWFTINTGSCYPQQLDKLPSPLPFSSGRSDLWIDVPDTTSVTHMMAAAISSSSPRLKKFLIQSGMYNMSFTDLGKLTRTVVNKALKDNMEFRVFIKKGTTCYYVHGSKYFVGSTTVSLRWTNPQTKLDIICPDGQSHIMSQEIVDAVYAKEEYQGQDATLFYWLTVERDNDTIMWKEVLKKWAPSPQVVAVRQRNTWKQIGVKVAFWLQDHPIAALCIGAAILIVPIILWKLGKKIFSKSDKQVILCNKCCMTTDRPLFHPECPGSPQYSDWCAARGKGTQPIGVKYNGRFMKYSDSEHYVIERPDHQAKLAEAEVGYHLDSWEGEFKIGDIKYKHGFTTDPSGVKQRWMTAEAEFCSGSDLPFSKNLVHITNPITGDRLYGMLMTQNVVRFPTHVMRSDWTTVLDMVADGKAYKIQPMVNYANADASYGLVMDTNQQRASVPGIKDITSQLVTSAELALIKSCTVYDPETKLVSTNLPMTYTSLGSPPVTPAGVELSDKGCVMQDIHTVVPFLKKGNCGAPAVAKVGASWKLLGLFSGNLPAVNARTFPSTTVEQWNDVVSKLNVVECCSSRYALSPVKVNFLLSPNAKETFDKPVFTEPYFATHIQTPKQDDPDVNHQEGCYTTIAKLPNPLPMDQKCRKAPIAEGAFSSVFGNIKSPVGTKIEIQTHHADKIPKDTAGHIHAENVRLNAAKKNIAGKQHPSSGFSEKFQHHAEMLGAFWSEQTSTRYTPLSAEEAIWGTTKIAPMDRNTSTGATFQLLWPGKSRKKDIFGETRGDWIGECGAWVRERIEYQWEAWKRGEMYVIPSSFTMKAELLDNKKLHKKRIVNVSDPITVVNMRRLMYPMQQAFTALGANSPFQLEMDPLVETHQLVKKLMTFDEHYDLDASAFDLTVPETMLIAAGKFLQGFSRSQKVLKQMLETCFATISYNPVLCGSTLMTKDAGVGSGICCTSFVDSIVIALSVYFSWQNSLVDPWTGCPELYYENVWTYSTGDDTTISTHSHSPLKVKGDAVVAFAGDILLMKYTDAGKEDGVEVVPKKLLELSYAGRSFCELPRYPGCYTGRLRESALSGAMCWTSSQDPVEISVCLFALLPEVAIYGADKYRQYTECLKVLYPGKLVPRWEALLEGLHQQIIASVQNNLIQERQFKIEQLKLADLPKVIPVKLNTDTLNNVYDSIKTTHTPKAEKMQPSNPKTMAKRVRAEALRDPESFHRGPAATQLCEAEILYQWVYLQAVPTVRVPAQNSPGLLRDLMQAATGKTVCWVSTYAQLQIPQDGGSHWVVARQLAGLARAAVKASEGGSPKQLAERLLRAANIPVPWPDPAFNPKTTHNQQTNFEACSSTPQQRLATQMAQLAVGYDEVDSGPFAMPPISDDWMRDLTRKDIDTRYEACSEKVASAGTAAPPNMEPASIGSANSGGSLPVGAQPDPLVATAIADTEVVRAITGSVKAPVILQQAGGIGRELTPQTGNAMNVFTVAGKKIYKNIIQINTGIGEGVVIFDYEINPWNQEILNNAQYYLANAHRRFFGKLQVHIDVVSAATVVGSLKIAFIPAVYAKGFKPTQSNIDAFNPMEFALNVTGSGMIEMVPTGGEYALTGVYRDSELKSFGRLVCISATNIDNSYASPLSVQLKLAFSASEDSVYDLYILQDTPDSDATLDNSIDLPIDNEQFIVSDGLRSEGFDLLDRIPGKKQLAEVSINGGMLDITPWIYGNNDDDVAWVCTTNPTRSTNSTSTTFPLPPNVVKANNPACQWLLYDAAGSKKLHVDTAEAARIQADVREKETDMVYNGFSAQGDLRGRANAFCYDIRDAQAEGHDMRFDSLMNDTVEQILNPRSPVRVRPITEILERSDGLIGGNKFVFTPGSGILKPADPRTIDKSVYWGEAIQGVCRLKVTGAIRCTQTSSFGNNAPPGMYAAKLVGLGDVAPAVNPNLTGQSIAASPRHLTAMDKAVKLLNTLGAQSVVTTVVGQDGTAICQILRNRKGMWIAREGSTMYGRIKEFLRDCTQKHRVSNVEFPSLLPTARGIMEDRVINTQLAAAMVDGAPQVDPIPYDEFVQLVKRRGMTQVMHACAAAVGAIGAGALGMVGNMVSSSMSSSASRYASDRQEEAARMVANTNYSAAVYTSNNNLEATRETLKNQFGIAKYNADKNLAGVYYNADQSFAAQKYSVDQNMLFNQQQLQYRQAVLNQEALAGTKLVGSGTFW
ncbi:hypothetical protein [Wenzhou picorna-like virus 46]|uniref:hypothetical protein n=1 Tax=Wenzhou picorna-like virus 46 TaxID=1923633 RepID=UPI00090AAFD4|nr:hypothetical protein [Wenzhou picorna-like virus 46]APG78500.1 hypothetical protein [Wenzhou picorna-like virus 46]